MNKDDKIIEILEEIRDLLKSHILGVQNEKQKNNITKSVSHSVKLSDWDTFFESKKTDNPYYIVALALHYLSQGDTGKSVEKKELKSFLENNVQIMNGRDVGADIGHTFTTYGYISSAGYGKYKTNTTAKEIVSTLPDEESLKSLSKKYEKHKGKKGRKKNDKKKK